MAQQFLMHRKKGTIYPYNPETAKNPNVVLYDPAKAKIRLMATRQMIEDTKAALTPQQQAAHSENIAEIAKGAKELAAAQNELEALHELPLQDTPPDQAEEDKSPEQAEKSRKAELIENDEHIKQIKAMKREKDVAKYLAREFGELVDGKETLETLKDKALNLRAGRILEGD